MPPEVRHQIDRTIRDAFALAEDGHAYAGYEMLRDARRGALKSNDLWGVAAEDLWSEALRTLLARYGNLQREEQGAL